MYLGNISLSALALKFNVSIFLDLLSGLVCFKVVSVSAMEVRMHRFFVQVAETTSIRNLLSAINCTQQSPKEASNAEETHTVQVPIIPA